MEENYLQSLSSQKLLGKDLFSNDKELTVEEINIRDYLFLLSNAYRPAVQEPMPDIIVMKDHLNFVTKQPDDVCQLYLNYYVFNQKVKQYDALGFDTMYFYFVELNDDIINLVTCDENKKILNSLIGELYVIVKFVDSAMKIEHNYVMFNILYPEKHPEFLKQNHINTFENTKTGKQLKKISNDNYLTCGIKYELAKVSKYIDEMDRFSYNFSTEIIRIDFTYCLGKKLTSNGNSVEGFYLVSLPASLRGPISFFPYYDQGSLEP